MANELKDNERAHPGFSAKITSAYRVDHGLQPDQNWIQKRHPLNGQFQEGLMINIKREKP